MGVIIHFAALFLRVLNCPLCFAARLPLGAPYFTLTLNIPHFIVSEGQYFNLWAQILLYWRCYMGACTICGKPAGLLNKICDECKEKDRLAKIAEQERYDAEKRRQAEEHKRIAEEERALKAEQQRAREEAARVARENKITAAIEALKSRLKNGEHVFIYNSFYVPVDSVLQNNEFASNFDITFLKKAGLLGWEVVGIIPRTIGIDLQNRVIGDFSNTAVSYGGGIGGNVAGVHILVKKELSFAMLETADDELISSLEGIAF